MFEYFHCHSAEEGTRVAVISGVVALVAQVVIYYMCVGLSSLQHLLGGGPDRRQLEVLGKRAGFVAHQVIALAYMVLLFVVGSYYWVTGDVLSLGSSVEAAADRLLSTHSVARWCAAVVLGELVVWDIPCGVLVPSLRDPLMFVHHVVMAIVAYIGVYHLPSPYYLFFFGVVELSSIPLAVVDFFHPTKGLPQLLEGTGSSLMRAVNESFRILFAVLFLLVRAVYFPYIVGWRLLPDALSIWTTVNANLPLGCIVVSSVGLTLLQLYWAVLILQQVVKMLRGDTKKGGKAHKKSQ